MSAEAALNVGKALASAQVHSFESGFQDEEPAAGTKFPILRFFAIRPNIKFLRNGASSHLKLPQQAAEHAAAAHGGYEQHTLNRVERGATGGPSAASAAEDPKRALVHALQNDLSRMSVLLERLDKLLSA